MIKVICWICGNNLANSEEHKFKSSDLRRLYGKKYNVDSENIGYHYDNSVKFIDSYKSKDVKFEKVICIDCNNNLTKPHDIAYDIFVKYLESNYDKIITENQINFKDVFGKNWKVQKTNLYKYYIKHAGCKIATGTSKDYLDQLSDFIVKSKTTNCFVFKILINTCLKSLEIPVLGNSSTVCFMNKETSIKQSFGGWCTYKWLSFVWVISDEISENKEIKYNFKTEIISKLTIDDFINLNRKRSYLETVEMLLSNNLDTIEQKVEYFKEMIN